MIRQNQKVFNIILVTIDSIVITTSLILAWLIRFQTNALGFGQSSWGFEHYMTPLLLILPLYFLLYLSFGLYKPQRTNSPLLEAIQIIKANFIGLLILVTALFVIDLADYSRYLIALFAIFSTIFSITERLSFRIILRYIRSKGFNTKFILIIGAGDLGKKIYNKIEMNEYLGYKIIGFLDDNVQLGHEIGTSKIIGKITDLDEIILNNQIDRIIISISPRHYTLLERIVDICEKYGVKADIVPDYYRYFPAKPYVDMIEDIPIIDIRHVPLDNSFKKVVKRIFDFTFAILSIVVLSPLLILLSILVRLTSPGPIIYKQDRLGLNRKKFTMYKFRSMEIIDENEEKTRWSTENDPRRTKLGIFMRKTSMDELPQLFNIMKGDMSLIGPRPERPYFIEKFREEIPKYMIKHHVRPGMTGWAQIHGWRGNTSIKRRIDYDIFYVENWSLYLDIKIFIMTLTSGIINKNEYINKKEKI